MKNIRILALVLALGAATTSVQAQSAGDRDDRVVVVVRPDLALEQRTVLARELLSLSVGPNFAKEFERAMGEQIGKIGEQDDEQATWVRANMPPMLSRMVARMIDEMVGPYAEIFTEEELRGQIDFYRTPIGQAVAAKSVTLGVALQESQTEAAMSFMTEFQAKFCAQFDCRAGGAHAAAKPSRH